MADKKADIDTSFVMSLRKRNQLHCHLKGCEEKIINTDERIGEHFTERHGKYLATIQSTLGDVVQECRNSQPDAKGERRFVPP
jgi:hypothetical protein